MTNLDPLIINSIYQQKTMQIFHQVYDDRDNNIFKTIFDIASNQLNNLNIINKKYSIPLLTIFFLLFNIQIFLIKVLDEKTIINGKHNIRLLALLSMDLNHDLVPKPKLTGIEKDFDIQRVLYISSKLYLEIKSSKQNELIVALKAVLLKNQALISNEIQNNDINGAKWFLSQKLGILFKILII
jgi:hypothetical protein